MTDADGFELLRNNLLTIGLVEPDTPTREVVELCMSFIIGNQEHPVKPASKPSAAAMTNMLREEIVRLASSGVAEQNPLTGLLRARNI